MPDVDYNDFNRSVIEQFRANGGKVGPPFEGAPMVLISHTGAKSGKKYTSPLVYSTDGDPSDGGRVVIIASKAGAPTHPHWYLNLKANPEVTVEIGSDTFHARAVEVTGDERDRLFRAQADLMPNFDEYEKLTDRKIPVLVLERI